MCMASLPQEPGSLPTAFRICRPLEIGLWVTLLACLGAAGSSLASGIPISSYEVRHTYPHDARAYTEGLYFLDGVLFESTGLEGRSDIRKVRMRDGVITQSISLEPSLFGEGIVSWGGEIISLTWRSHVGFR